MDLLLKIRTFIKKQIIDIKTCGTQELFRKFYLLIKYPFMTLKVIMGIHWEALKLWCKGLNLVKRPPAPKKAFTFVSTETLEKTIERH